MEAKLLRRFVMLLISTVNLSTRQTLAYLARMAKLSNLKLIDLHLNLGTQGKKLDFNGDSSLRFNG